MSFEQPPKDSNIGIEGLNENQLREKLQNCQKTVDEYLDMQRKFGDFGITPPEPEHIREARVLIEKIQQKLGVDDGAEQARQKRIMSAQANNALDALERKKKN